MNDLSREQSLQALWASSQLDAGNAAYLEQMFEDYLQKPDSVPPNLRTFFETLPKNDGQLDVSHREVQESFKVLARQSRSATVSVVTTSDENAKQVRVLQLINAYRFRGHQLAHFNPLGQYDESEIEELTLDYYDLNDTDLGVEFNTGSLVGPERATLSEIINILQDTYSDRIGAEYMYISNTVEKRWLQQRLESGSRVPYITDEQRLHLLKRLTAAEGMEHYLHSKYVGQKRFSLEGGESLIPMLDEIIQRGGSHGLQEIIIGMAHRGRLNVLVNIMGKQPADLFMEFEGKHTQTGNGSGDVKYHMGFSSNIRTPGEDVHVALAFNPSHLEIVGPVVEGSVRARQDRRKDNDGVQVLPVVIHGDAAFSGQGVVMETLSMSQSRGYSTKGTVHIVINNQIGFTCSSKHDARSSVYCTDVAKMLDVPIFHVDGDDPEAVSFVTQIALDYRMAFNKDVVIDLVCYRRHGHSEADEPMVTQPMMYTTIKSKDTTRAIYAKRLIEDGLITESQADALIDEYQDKLDAGECTVEALMPEGEANYPYAVNWSNYVNKACEIEHDVSVSLEKIRALTEKLLSVPEGFVLHGSVAKVMGNRHKMAAGSMPIDWGYAETLAYASLLTEGYHVRLSGQDSGRGTFFHRHAVVHNQENGESYVPLRNLTDDQSSFLVIDSLLSEEAVLAFEYGYATTDPKTLTIWEAQFGDFANNAQVVIDQFISAGEQKWSRLCGLVMLLPHGYEGQGPEHTSARLERYLQLCAEHNMQVCIPTLPSQIFHLLRRQMHQSCRKPLIVLSPKSLLRHRLAVNTLEDLTEGEFQQVIPEIDEMDENSISRVVLCSGKVYFDLLEKRRQQEMDNVAIIRLEQLYPFPARLLEQQIQRYPNLSEFVWCQEEPMNQGAWYSSQHHMKAVIGERNKLQYAGRPLSAAPAVGYASVHVQQQHALVNDALGINE
ncbi:MAG: 2-oxoglutarate dehydrogenase E1 component [Gammaproteobacteria bacterium]|nr:2-oxoglutarate dehydrogenase E1 component [Gammaproteobacteria bacterium]